MGNIGVGTTSPLAKLDVYGDMILSGVSRYLNFGDTSGSGGYGIRDNGGVIEFKNTGGSWLGIGSGGGGGSDGNWSYFNGSGIRLATSSNNVLIGANSTTTSSRLEVIGSGYFSGNLGIGTTSPWRTLSVKGNSDLGNNALAGSFTATSTTASVFPYASSTALTVSGNLYVNTYNGPLQANNGVVSATTSIGVVYGGTGASSFGQGWIYSSGGTSSLAASTSPTVNYLVATSTTATSTFAGPISIIGSSGLNVLTNGRVGIGTTSPYAQLSVAGVGAFDSLNVNSSATSTFFGGIQTNALNVTSSTASSTFANGISLSGGCYAINGTCIGSGTVDGSGSANKLAFWTGASTLSYNNNLSWLNSSSKFGIGTSTPNWDLQIASSSGATIAITDTSATANTKHWTLSSLGGNFYLSQNNYVLYIALLSYKYLL
jgi:hypothetical protein